MPDRWVNPHGWGPPAGPPEGWEPPTQQQPPDWGSPPPPRPSAGRDWWRRWYVLLAAVLVVLGIVALSDDSDPANTASRATSPPTTAYSLPTVATSLPTTSTIPSTTVATVEVPKLVGMRLASAKAALADRGLRGTVRYQTTSRYRAGTVISQSRRTGAGVLPDTSSATDDRAAAATTAAHRAGTQLRSVLPRRVPGSQRLGLRLHRRLRQRAPVCGGPDPGPAARSVRSGR